MDHTNGTHHHSHHSNHHHSNGNHHRHHHNSHESHVSNQNAPSGELIKQSSDNEMRVCIEHTPQEFPILMTAAKSSENVIFDLDVNEYEHVHIEKSVSNNIINFSSSELDMPAMKQIDHVKKVIDCLSENKNTLSSDDDRQRMSIILNATNEIKDMCMDQFQKDSSNHDLFCKMIKEKWDRAVDEMSELNSKIVTSPPALF